MPQATKIDLAKGNVLTVIDAASEIGVHYTTLYRWIDHDEVAFVTFGRTIFIPYLEVERLKKAKSDHKTK